MYAGRSITDVAMEIERQQIAKKDFLVSTNALEVDVTDSGAVNLSFGDNVLSADDHALRQISEHTGIPAKYFDRCRREAPALLANNLTHWLHASNDKRLVRTLDNRARAFLSDRYQRIDHNDVAQVVLPALSGVAGLQIVSCEITDRKLYIKAVTQRIQGEVRKGDVLQAGVAISNSEIGMGALRVDPLLFRLVCMNGLIRADESFSKYHVGGRTTIGDNAYALLSDETLKADDRAILLKTRDVVAGALSEATFAQALERAREAAGQKVTGNPAKVIEVLANKVGISEAETGGILRHLIEGGDLSRWGVVNAITAFSQAPTLVYDRATELETVGGKVLDLAASEWQEIAIAA